MTVVAGKEAPVPFKKYDQMINDAVNLHHKINFAEGNGTACFACEFSRAHIQKFCVLTYPFRWI